MTAGNIQAEKLDQAVETLKEQGLPSGGNVTLSSVHLNMPVD